MQIYADKDGRMVVAPDSGSTVAVVRASKLKVIWNPFVDQGRLVMRADIVAEDVEIQCVPSAEEVPA